MGPLNTSDVKMTVLFYAWGNVAKCLAGSRWQYLEFNWKQVLKTKGD